MSTSQIQAVTAEELFAQLRAVDGLERRGVQGRERIYHCWDDQKVVAQAQQVLLSCGYVLIDWPMIEHNTYVFGYVPMDSVYPDINHWPYHIELRLFTDVMTEPPLAPVYHDGIQWRRFESYPRSMYGTATSDASKVRSQFNEAHPDKALRWLPLLDDFWPFPE